jgi:signal transduction histidine kinase
MAINTSIQVIKKLSDPEEPISDEDAELLGEAIDISESEVERIRDIISGLLDFHRLDREDFCRLSLNKTMEESIAILNWGKKLKTIDIVQTDDGDCFVYGAPIKLKQVFINFILNAAEAAAPEEAVPGRQGKLKIDISTTPDNKYAVVHFIDNGPGLPPEVRGSLFEPFVTTKDDKGVGLGLYISYKIIRNHRGEIVYDEEYKNGTHFIIKLPLDVKRS